MKEELSRWGDEINPPATEEGIKRLAEETKKRFQVEIPSEHIDFLKEMDGLEYNGCMIYGVDEELLEEIPDRTVYGLLEYNDMRSQGDKEKRLSFAESETLLYIYSFEDKSYYQLDNFLYKKLKKYNSYAEMIKDIIKKCIE
ncbi:YrhA family protein [Butyrivibrio sp. WCD2001]|uniref:YrhA family protein n=1 Tax=Butyrivibrio sp. WCD2001 TaxID=1280681 RepID=UPI00210F5075|nr:YrhA family protein [Butyrivibrio sp. WCD2001]